MLIHLENVEVVELAAHLFDNALGHLVVALEGLQAGA